MAVSETVDTADEERSAGGVHRSTGSSEDHATHVECFLRSTACHEEHHRGSEQRHISEDPENLLKHKINHNSLTVNTDH